MQNLRIGIQTRSLRQPLKQALHTAAELGASGVEIDFRNELKPAELSQTGQRQLRKLLGDLNLRLAAAAFPTRRGYGDRQDLERRVSATQMAMTAAYELGAKVVVNRVGVASERNGEDHFARLVEALTVLGKHGERCGARLTAQTGLDSGEDLARLMEALPDEAVGVDLHPSGLIHHGHSPQAAISQVGRYVLHVHACDAVRDLSLGGAVEVELGRGTADLPSLLGRLEEFGYQGWVTIERRDAADPIAEIGNAVAYLRSL